MDSPRFVKGNNKRGLISKTWERCKSFSGGIGRKSSCSRIQYNLQIKSNLWPCGLTSVRENDQEEKVGRKKSSRVTPEGCFSIYVGLEKQRFVIKTEYVNHPIFKILLEEAESEYGYSNEGPLVLPCEVSRFEKVLMEMDSDQDDDGQHKQSGCSRFVSTSHSSYHMLTPIHLG